MCPLIRIFFTSNPAFYPVQAQSTAIYRFQELVEEELLQMNTLQSENRTEHKYNLTYAQRESLKKTVGHGRQGWLTRVV